MSASRQGGGRWGVGARLTSSFLLLGVLLVAIAGIGLLVTARATDAVTGLSDRQLPLQRANSELGDVVTDASTSLRGYGITGDQALLASYQRRWAEYRPALQAAQSACRDDAAACRSLQAQDAEVQRWYRHYAVPIAAGERALGLRPDAYRSARRLLDSFATDNEQLGDRLQADVAEVAAAAGRQQRTGRMLLLGGAALGVLLAAATGRSAVTALVPPLARLRKVLRRLAAGDCDARAAVEGPAEVRAVSESVNVLAEQSSRLRAEDQARARIRQLARDLDRRMRDHLHADAVAYEVVHGIGAALGVDRADVRLAQDGPAGPVAAQWTTPGTAEVAPDVGLSAAEWQAWVEIFGPDQQPAVLDAPALAELVARRGDSALVAGVGTALVAPLVAGSELVGTLSVGRRDAGRQWTTAELSLLEAVAADMGRAVHHARLFEQQSRIVGQLRGLDRTKSDFLSTISHELRTPLTSIAGYVEMIRDGDAGPLQPMQENMLEVVARNTQRLRDLIEDVLMISRVESGAVRSERVPVVLSSLLEAVVATLRPLADTGGVRLDVVPGGDGDQAFVLGDPAQLDRVLLNLVGNAVKFTPRGGQVTLSVRATPEQVMLRVQDTGIGVPAGEIDSMFGRFFRASNATARQIPGTGLGLAIVASLVAAHDGRIDVQSVEREGTTVTVTVPRLAEREQAMVRASAALRL